MMTYKGFLATVTFDDDVGIFHGEVANLRDVITCQGQSVDELRKAFRDSVEDYLEFCAERGEEPEKPLSGRFLVRVPPELHRSIFERAARRGLSVNRWVRAALERAVEADETV
jgi:predicted HicB family RNase H-like nuclease